MFSVLPYHLLEFNKNTFITSQFKEIQFMDYM
jgi:hypothetical protein